MFDLLEEEGLITLQYHNMSPIHLVFSKNKLR